MKVLNVGSAAVGMPAKYSAWDVVRLDIDPGAEPDICLDARRLTTLEAAQFDAVYCSHNLEHFYRHEVPGVLEGIKHVLKPGGFVEIHVPDLMAMAKAMTEPDDVWYESELGPITFHDVLYGYGQAVATGNTHYAHKCGFSANSLGEAVHRAGFDKVEVYDGSGNLLSYGVKP